ncbi:hypothetical protein [Arenibacterium sp. LLYu02]|uniref:hypothetical protein n=1 Tax=Arenibacterium sp. LLYu02 TaxID=3404132 RepID=UPI003B21DCD6
MDFVMPNLSLRVTRIGSSVTALALILAGPAGAAVLFEPRGPGATVAPQVLHLAQVVAPSIPQTRDTRADRNGGDNDNARPAKVVEEENETALTEVVEIIAEGSRSCQSVSDVYTVDCIAKHLRAAAATLPREKAFNEAQSTLSTAAAELEQLVRQNTDPTQPRVTVRLDSATSPRTPPLRAVTPGVTAETRAQALQVLEEATTVLLRSAETSQGRATQFQRIADAINSNKVLLRS